MKSWLKHAAIAVLIFLWCYLVFSVFIKLPEQEEVVDMAVSDRPNSGQIEWKTVNLLREPLPNDIPTESVFIETGTVSIEGVNVFYRKASAPAAVKSTGMSLLLLHGRSFKSETWEELGTLNIMAALGHLVLAVDLPGYGETKQTYHGDKSKFILSIVKSDLLNGTHPVLVSPSMSGEYSVKFIGEHSDLLLGYIPVAPVATGSVPQSVLKSVKIPTYIFQEGDFSAQLKKKNCLTIIPGLRM